VPPCMRNSSTPQQNNQPLFWDSTPQSDNQRFNSNRQSLVNTSKPAKDAPKLNAGTLASLTKQTTSSVPLKSVNVQSDQDFPSLGGSTKVSQVSLNNNYASLARSWGEQKKEDDERAKKEAKEVAEKKRLEKEKEEKERRSFQVRSHTFYALSKKNNDDEKYDLGDSSRVIADDDSYQSSPSDNDIVDDDDDDQQNEDELDDAWNRRRSKNDLY
jgi:hypothetical protein